MVKHAGAFRPRFFYAIELIISFLFGNIEFNLELDICQDLVLSINIGDNTAVCSQVAFFKFFTKTQLMKNKINFEALVIVTLVGTVLLIKILTILFGR